MIKSKQVSNITCICMMLLLALISSCKKTEVVAYDKQSADRMLEYKVTNAAEDIYGIIDNVDNSITVYIPYYISVDFIIPKIKLEEGAALIDKDGNEISLVEDLDPVLVNTEGYTYTVKDGNGEERTYTLKIQIVPYYKPLATGYGMTRDADNNYVADTAATAEVLVNSSFYIYGNFESSSSNGKLTLISNKTNEVIPNGLTLEGVTRSTEYHYMTASVSADVDSGYYHIEVEHLGRKDTLPTIHLIYKKPVFDYLSKTYTIGDTVTLKVAGQSGVNTGISGMYFLFSSAHPYQAGSSAGVTFQSYEGLTEFPTELYDKPIALKIVDQDRNSVKFIFPDIPAGYYSNWIDTGLLAPSSINLFFDFESTEWGKNNRLSIGGVYLDAKPKAK